VIVGPGQVLDDLKMKLKNQFPLPLLPLLLAPVILLSPVLFTGKALFWGTPALQFIPWWQWAFDTLLSGHLPLWNPLVGMGAPLIANYQSALFYPPNWIYFIFYVFGGISFLAWSQALVVILHLIWASIGMAGLMRRLGLGRLAQTVSGLAFGLSGYLVARAWFASISSTIAWLPWVMWFGFDLVVKQSKFKTLLKLGVVLGLQLLAGHAQSTWYTWLLAGLWVGFWSWQNQENSDETNWEKTKSFFKNWVLLGVTIFIGIALAAIQLIPTAEYLLQSQRSATVDYELAMGYSFWPWRLVGLLTPNFFGSQAHGDYWGYGSFWEDAIYIGIVPILLTLAALRRGLASSKKIKPASEWMPPTKNLIRFLFVVIIIAFVFALGDNTAIFPWLFRNMPTFDMFRSPTRFSIWAVFAMAILSGFGVEQWRKPINRGLYWTRLGTAGAFAITIGAGLGWWFLREVVTDFRPTFVPALAIAGLWGMGAGILALTAAKETGRNISSKWGWGVILLVLIDLLVAGWGLNPGIDTKFYQLSSSSPSDPNLLATQRVLIHPKTEDQIKYKQYFTLDTFSPKLQWEDLYAIKLPNLNMLQHIPVVNNYDPLVPGRYAVWMENLADRELKNHPDLLDLMAVNELIWTAPISATETTRFLLDRSARVRWVPCARYIETDQEALELVFDGGVNFDAEVILTGDHQVLEQECLSFDYPIKIISEHPNKAVIQLGAHQPGWVVLSDVFYPGWRAYVDDEPSQIQPANYLFRAIEVPAGEHEITFTYRPWSFYSGVLISSLSWIGLFFVWDYLRRHSSH
jgi:hypothetical protein